MLDIVLSAAKRAAPRLDGVKKYFKFGAVLLEGNRVALEKNFGAPKGGLSIGARDGLRQEPLKQLRLWRSVIDVLRVCEHATTGTRRLTIGGIRPSVAQHTGVALSRADFLQLDQLGPGVLLAMGSLKGLGEPRYTLTNLLFYSFDAGRLVDAGVIKREGLQAAAVCLATSSESDEAGSARVVVTAAVRERAWMEKGFTS